MARRMGEQGEHVDFMDEADDLADEDVEMIGYLEEDGIFCGCGWSQRHMKMGSR